MSDFIATVSRDRDNSETWILSDRIWDATHSHSIHDLYIHGRPVVDYKMRLHYNRNGWIDYASHSWEVPFDVAYTRNGFREYELRDQILERYERLYGRFAGLLQIDRVYWVDSKNEIAVPALEVRLFSDWPLIAWHEIYHEDTLERLESKKTVRFVSNNIYKIHPVTAGIASVSIDNLTSSTILKNEFIHVRRDQSGTVPTSVIGNISKQDVDPNTAYTPGDEQPAIDDPAAATYSYGANCTSGCTEQNFDAVNVYYHLNDYRRNLKAYFDTLGVAPNLGFDPLPVVVNSLAVDFDEDGTFGDEANNAAYVQLTSEGTVSKALVFLRPAASATTASTCPNKRFFNVAREATTVVHEYQHYVTDRITGMISASKANTVNVGDIIHEGYSDYLATSQITRLNGETTVVTKLLDYSFRHCSQIIRDVNVLTPLENTVAFQTDEHYGGLTWASALWQLREEFGREIIDLVTLKSLFFLSVKPSSAEAVEALVQADNILYGGNHVGRIRKLFYNDLKFVGGNTTPFRDATQGLLEMGFQSCSSIGRRTQAIPSLASLLLWIACLFFASFKLRKSRWTSRTGFFIIFLPFIPTEVTAKTVRKISEEAVSPQKSKLFLSIGVDGIGGRVSFSDARSTGWGYSGRLGISLPIVRQFRVTGTAGYQIFQLKRSLVVSSVIEEPTSLEFTQKIGYLGVSGILGVALYIDEKDLESARWYLDLGGDLLFPVSAVQKNDVSGQSTFSSSDRPFMLLAGISLEKDISSRWILCGALHAHYNLASTSGSKLYGIRASIAGGMMF